MYRNVSFVFSKWVPISDWHTEKHSEIDYFFMVDTTWTSVFMVVLCSSWWPPLLLSPGVWGRNVASVFVPCWLKLRCFCLPWWSLSHSAFRALGWLASFLPGCLVLCGSLVLELAPSIVWTLGFPCVSLWILSPQLVALFCKIVEPLEFRSSWIKLAAGLGLQVCSPSRLSWVIYVRGGGYLTLLTPRKRITHANLPYPSWWTIPEIGEPEWSLLLSCLLSGVVTAMRELTNPESLSLRSDSHFLLWRPIWQVPQPDS